MTLYFDTELFKVQEFYKYPTCVVCRIAEYTDELRSLHGDKDVKRFFENCLKVAEEKTGRALMDNKVAMKVLYKPTNTVLYVGYKDNIWCIGLELNNYMTGTKIDLTED